MGKYTVLEDPQIDEYIDCYLERVVHTIFEYIPRVHIRSIILGGSFGKGDGSVIVDALGVKPQRDFDLGIIMRRRVPPVYVVELLKKRLANKFCSITDPDYHLMGNLIPEIKITTLENINSLPDISTYDLKNCKIMYGEDIRSKIVWELKDLPLRTNARALFQKGIALIGAFRRKYLSEGIPPQLRTSFLRETSRAYIEICVGLCLLAKRYDSSCSKRLDTLKKIYRSDFKELCKAVPHLIDKTELSTKYKLDPSNNEINVDPINYWFETRDDLGEVMKFYFCRYLGIPFENWMQFSTCLERNLTQEYYIPVITSFLKNKNISPNSYVSSFANIVFNARENMAYTWLNIKKGHLSLPLLKNMSSPSIKAFTVVPLLLFSITPENKINSEYVNLALKKLSFVKTKANPAEDAWSKARRKLLKLVFSTNMI
jgi:hypothetical protein